MEPETVPDIMQKTTDDYLWLCVFAADAAHVPAAFRFGQAVCQSDYLLDRVERIQVFNC